MPYRVDLEKHFYHPKTGKRLSLDKAKSYNRRATKRIRPQLWLVVRKVLGDPKLLSSEERAYWTKVNGRIEYMARITQKEAILTPKKPTERHIRRTLGQHQTFSKLYDDFEVPGDANRRGVIRVTISGVADGRRIKEVIHLGFHRAIWELNYRSRAHAKEGFKEMLTAAILSNLRRRGLRLSNPIESARRIQDLTRSRQGKLELMEFEERPAERGGLMEQVRWTTNAIRLQRKSKQLQQVKISIDKLI